MMKCRACNSTNLFTAIDLGNLPVAGAFLDSVNDSYNEYETKMLVCKSCGLGQISLDMSPEDLYSTYNWRTSTSKSYVEYAQMFANKHILPNVSADDWVLEIASNDGYLLKYLAAQGVDVLGVDPAKNISMYAICSGVPVITEFFNADIARQILEKKGYPRWIVANNVMAHTPDIQSFMEGISILSNRNTVVTIENPTIMNILNHDHFDVIFHEHYSYLSAMAVSKLASKNDMKLFGLDWVDTQGGSNRYWLSKSEQVQAHVAEHIAKELSDGLLSETAWGVTQDRISSKIDRFRQKVVNLYLAGNVICGFAASAKSTITLNFAKIKPGYIEAIADDVKEKQGHIVPGPMIPIVSTADMLSKNPDDIIIFSWNIYNEILDKIRQSGSSARVWVWND